MGLNDTGKNVGLDAIRAVITHLGLHSGTEGSGSSNELTGGSPAYARQACAWGAAAAGVTSLSGTEVFDVPAGSTVSRVGLWSASTSGTFYGDGNVTDEVYAGQGTYTVSSGSISITG
jgi:hypothetical protein